MRQRKHINMLLLVLLTALPFFGQTVTRIAPPVILGAVKPADQEFSSGTFLEDLQNTLKTATIEDALALFEEVPFEYIEDPTIQYVQASLLLSSGSPEEADVLAQSLLEKNPKDTEVLFLNAYIAKGLGDDARKASLIKEILKIDPENSDANAEMGNDYILKRKWKTARTYYIKSIQSNPKNQTALLGYGQTNYYLDDLKRAKQAFTQLVGYYPEESIGYSYLAKLSAEEENYAEAVTYIEKAISLDDSYYAYWLEYGSYLRYRGKFEEAVAALDVAEQLYPEDFLIYVYRAGIYELMEDFDSALEDYRNIVRYNTKYIFAYESIGIYAWGKGNWTESRAAFQRAYELNPSNVSYALMISACLQKEGKVLDNKKFLEQAARKVDRATVDYAVIRLYYDRIGDESVLQRVQSLDSVTEKGKLLYYMALFYELNKMPDTAHAIYSEVVLTKTPMFFEYRLCEWALETLKVFQH